MSMNDFKNVRGNFIEVHDWCNTECHDTSLAAKCSHVSVNANIDVFADQNGTFGIGSILLLIILVTKKKEFH